MLITACNLYCLLVTATLTPAIAESQLEIQPIPPTKPPNPPSNQTTTWCYIWMEDSWYIIFPHIENIVLMKQNVKPEKVWSGLKKGLGRDEKVVYLPIILSLKRWDASTRWGGSSSLLAGVGPENLRWEFQGKSWNTWGSLISISSLSAGILFEDYLEWIPFQDDAPHQMSSVCFSWKINDADWVWLSSSLLSLIGSEIILFISCQVRKKPDVLPFHFKAKKNLPLPNSHPVPQLRVGRHGSAMPGDVCQRVLFEVFWGPGRLCAASPSFGRLLRKRKEEP